MRSSFLLRLLPVFFLCLPGFAYAQEIPPEEEPVDESVVYIFEDTTWTKDSEWVFDRPVLVNGATLTIEEGVKVRFTKNDLGYEPGMLQVQSGRIMAHGTEAKPIIFDRLQSDDHYWIDFYSSLDENPSVFRYVQFLHGGKAEEVLGGGDMTTVPGVPTLQYQEGFLRIENSLWKGSLFSDVKVRYPYQWGDYLSYLHIINSNFAYDQSIAEDNPSNVIEIESWPNIAVDAAGSSCPSNRTCQPTVTLRNDYYGDISGPKGDIENPDAFLRYGKRILGYVDYAGYRNTSLIADPLFVIPGILGSQQNSNGEWVIDPILHAYDDLIASLKKNGYEEGKNLFIFPYDWYRKNEDTAELLKQKIDTVKEQTGSNTMDIAAHSMGGLVARSYAETGEKAKNIDQLITIGTPHRGAPEAYLKWEAGEGFFTMADILLKHHFTQEAEESGFADIYDLIRQQIFSVQQLLSIDDYLFDTTTASSRSYADNYPRNEFLEQLTANETSLDTIRKRVAIAGNTGNTTISSIRVTDTTDGEKWQHGKPENFDNEETDRGLERSNGDRTVPLSSAQAFPGAEQIVIDAKHSDLPEAAQCDIFEELSGKTTCLESHVTDIPNILLLHLFSPIDLQIISPSNKKMGKNFETGEIYNEIPGAFYSGYQTKSEFVTIPNPEEGEYRILTQGTGTGPYRVEITHLSEDTQSETTESTVTIRGEAESGVEAEAQVEVAENTVALVGENHDTTPPVTSLALSGTLGLNHWYTSDVIVALSATDDLSGIEKTEYSLNGGEWTVYVQPLTLSDEGTTEIKYRSTDEQSNQEPEKTEIIKIDKTAPEAKISFNPLTQKLDVSGRDALSVVSVVTLEKSDMTLSNKKIKPIKAWFSRWHKKHQRNLPDMLATLTDQAGHTTSLIFEKTKDKQGFAWVKLRSLSYDDGEAVMIQDTQAAYKWKVSRKGGYQMFASSIKAGENRLESHYLPKQNETWIMEHPEDLRDDDHEEDHGQRLVRTRLSGMVVPYLETERGEVKAGY